MVPYSFIRRGSAEVVFRKTGGWWGESYEGTRECIRMAQQAGLKVMLKPHTWVSGQGWAGDFALASEAEWQTWERSYRDYILTYAHLADSMQVEIFCIGTEYRQAVKQRPDFWKKLIGEVRNKYHGQVTYAANWDNYHNVAFWDDLDYIGVDAYFPLSAQAHPTAEELALGWDSVKNVLRQWSERHKKPILFTEYGYKSIQYTNSGHWNYSEDTVMTSQVTQATAYEALYRATWNEPWMAGGFWWKWHFADGMRHRPRHKDYTPQGKQAEEVIKDWYGGSD